ECEQPVSNSEMVLLLALALLAGTAQETPEHTDFTGRWVLDTVATSVPDAAHELIVVQPVTRTNVRGEPMKPAYLSISIRRESACGTREETRHVGVAGGTVGGITRDGQRLDDSSHAETFWQGDALILTNGTYGPDGRGTGKWTERREAWSLTTDG